MRYPRQQSSGGRARAGRQRGRPGCCCGADGAPLSRGCCWGAAEALQHGRGGAGAAEETPPGLPNPAPRGWRGRGARPAETEPAREVGRSAPGCAGPVRTGLGRTGPGVVGGQQRVPAPARARREPPRLRPPRLPARPALPQRVPKQPRAHPPSLGGAATAVCARRGGEGRREPHRPRVALFTSFLAAQDVSTHPSRAPPRSPFQS